MILRRPGGEQKHFNQDGAGSGDPPDKKKPFPGFDLQDLTADLGMEDFTSDIEQEYELQIDVMPPEFFEENESQENEQIKDVASNGHYTFVVVEEDGVETLMIYDQLGQIISMEDDENILLPMNWK